MGSKGVIEGVILGVLFSTVVILSYIYLVKSAFGDVESPNYPTDLRVKYNDYLKSRGFSGWLVSRLNLGMYRAYRILGYDRLTRQMNGLSPDEVWLELNRKYTIDSVTTFNLSTLIMENRPSSTLPPDVVLKEKYGDCDDFALFVASMFNESYLVSVFVYCNDSLGFHAFPVVSWGNNYYIIDYVGSSYLKGGSVVGVIKKYVKNKNCKIYVDGIYRVN